MKGNTSLALGLDHIRKSSTMAGLALLLSPALAWATPITSYLQSTIHMRDCITACFQPNNISLQQFIDQDYGEDGHTEVHSVWQSLNTQSAASAGFSGNSYTPTLSAYSYTSDKFQYTTGAFGFQRYEFTGTGTITLGGHLTYSQSGVASLQDRGAYPEGRVTAAIFSFQMTNDIFDMDDCTVTNPQFIVFGKTPLVCALPVTVPTGSITVSMPNRYNFQSAGFNAGNTPVSGGSLDQFLTISGNAGDVFFLGATMAALAHFDGFADSRNTLRLSIDNPDLVAPAFTQNSFRPAPIATPEPSMGLLLLSGVAMMLRSGKKRPAR